MVATTATPAANAMIIRRAPESCFFSCEFIGGKIINL